MEYKNYRLSELLEIIGGGTPKTNIEEYWNGNIPWLSVKDFNGDSKKVYTTEKKITELGLNNSSTKLLKEGDLIISARGTVGEIAQLGKAMAFNQSCYGLRAKEHITSNDFMYYALKYILKDIKNMTHGSVFDTITRSTFDVLSYPLPEMKEQKSIAKILSNLDDKIEVNNKINQKLEEMAQGIFKQWFIDFDFPNEEGKPYKSSGGEMVESELGMIPKGWEVVTIEELSSFIARGVTPKYEEYSSIKVLNQKVNRGALLEKQYLKYLREDIKVPNEKYACKWDILLNSLGQGTLGRVHLYKENTNDVVVDQHISILRMSNKELAIYIYNLLSGRQYQSYMDGLVSGSTGMQMLNISKIRAIKIIKPTQSDIKHIEKIVNIYEKIQKNISENEVIANIRNILLPKLMSGEIRVPIKN